MQKVKCPHCKKNIELSEVAKEQAKHLAAQEIKQLKAQNQDDLKKTKKDLEGKYAKDREKDAETIKELKASRKTDLEKAQQDAEKKLKKNLESKYAKDREKDAEIIKELKDSRKKDAESIAAVRIANVEKKFNKEKDEGAQREAELKLKLERVQKDLKKATQKSEQGLTADQGATQHNFLGNLLKELFADTDDEIISYETGEPGADWLHKVKKDGLEIGRILYESKKTQRFEQKWYGKLQKDMSDANADIGIIFTTAVPREFNPKQGFIERGNQFVCNFDSDKLKILAKSQRKILTILNLINKDKKEDNKKSALEFLNSPEIQNILNSVQVKMFTYVDTVGKLKKVTKDMEENNQSIDGIFDDFFDLTKEFGLKKLERKKK
tara:strand:- start:898 stop:2040 length:1143 start_codon:yes stop_codon:yes gene_type:complete